MAHPKEEATFPGSGWVKAHTQTQMRRQVLPLAHGWAVRRGAGKPGWQVLGQLAALQTEVMLCDTSQKFLLKNQVLGIATPSLGWKPETRWALESGVSTSTQRRQAVCENKGCRQQGCGRGESPLPARGWGSGLRSHTGPGDSGLWLQARLMGQGLSLLTWK